MPLLLLILILLLLLGGGVYGIAANLFWLVIVAFLLVAIFGWFGGRPYYSRWRGGGPPPY